MVSTIAHKAHLPGIDLGHNVRLVNHIVNIGMGDQFIRTFHFTGIGHTASGGCKAIGKYLIVVVTSQDSNGIFFCQTLCQQIGNRTGTGETGDPESYTAFCQCLMQIHRCIAIEELLQIGLYQGGGIRKALCFCAGFGTHGQIACPFRLIACAANSNGEQNVRLAVLLLALQLFCTKGYGDAVGGGLFLIGICEIDICALKAKIGQQLVDIAAFILVFFHTVDGLAGVHCSHCQNQRHGCQMIVILGGIFCKITVGVIILYRNITAGNTAEIDQTVLNGELGILIEGIFQNFVAFTERHIGLPNHQRYQFGMGSCNQGTGIVGCYLTFTDAPKQLPPG